MTRFINPLLALFAVILVAAYAGWLLNTFQPQTRTERSATRHVPDYYLEGIEATLFAPDGRPRYRLRAARSEHFPDDGSTELQRPHLRIETPPAPWQVRAERGRILDDGRQIWLLGAVQADRPATGQRPALSLTTRDLLVRPQQEVAETGARAVLTSGLSRLQGTGLRLDMASHRLRLLADVEGRYVLAN